MSETKLSKRVLEVRVNIEKTSGGGEDAEPLLWRSQDGSRCVIGVFDGLGGAGSVLYGETPEQHTGAYYASRYAREISLELFQELPSGAGSEGSGLLSELEGRLRSGLKERADGLSRCSVPRLKSTLIRTLPTTVALIHSCRQGNEIDCQAIWAGDSRAFHLHPAHGLQQLTRDDLVSGGDPLENLINDSPLSNYVSADGSFHLNASPFRFPLPTALLVATDGCFGYVPTPVHFEYLLLETLDRASSCEEWQENLRQRFTEIAGDDASLSLIAIGWDGIEEIHQAFYRRFAELESEYIKAHDKLVKDLGKFEDELKSLSESRDRCKERVQQSREMIWKHYGKTYMQQLGERADAEPSNRTAEGSGEP